MKKSVNWGLTWCHIIPTIKSEESLTSAGVHLIGGKDQSFGKFCEGRTVQAQAKFSRVEKVQKTLIIPIKSSPWESVLILVTKEFRALQAGEFHSKSSHNSRAVSGGPHAPMIQEDTVKGAGALRALGEAGGGEGTSSAELAVLCGEGSEASPEEPTVYSKKLRNTSVRSSCWRKKM